jgi:hypothetical protein
MEACFPFTLSPWNPRLEIYSGLKAAVPPILEIHNTRKTIKVY